MPPRRKIDIAKFEATSTDADISAHKKSNLSKNVIQNSGAKLGPKTKLMECDTKNQTVIRKQFQQNLQNKMEQNGLEVASWDKMTIVHGKIGNKDMEKLTKAIFPMVGPIFLSRDPDKKKEHGQVPAKRKIGFGNVEAMSTKAESSAQKKSNLSQKCDSELRSTIGTKNKIDRV